MDFTPLRAPKLDPRNERDLAELALQRTYTQSGGTLNDFSPGSPLRVISEMVAFTCAELLYYVNKLPLATAIQFLQIAGIQRRVGNRAQATLVFTLTTPLGDSYIIPEGYAVLTADKTRKFRTVENLVIPPGNTSGSVNAVCTTLGEGGNVKANTITKTIQSLPFLDSITNPNAASGGLGSETLKQVQARAFKALRRRGLITREDYLDETHQLLGEGSTVRVIGNLSDDGRSTFPGSVHVFVLNPGGTALNQAQRESLRTALRAKSQVGIKVFVSSADRHEIAVRLVAKLVPGTSPPDTANTIWQRLSRYFRPGDLPLGEPVIIDSIRYQARLSNLAFVEFAEVRAYSQAKGYTSNYPLPSRWSVPVLKRLDVTLSDGDNEFSYGYTLEDS